MPEHSLRCPDCRAKFGEYEGVYIIPNKGSAFIRCPICDKIYTISEFIHEIQQTIPDWLKQELQEYIQFCFENLERSAQYKNKLSDSAWKGNINAIRWVLSLKKPEVNNDL